jgi:P-type Na+/K+ transporter
LDASVSFLPSPEAEPTTTAPLTEEVRSAFMEKYEQLASQGLRVIGLAQRIVPLSQVEGIERQEAEKDFTFLALVGIHDPPRPETVGAVRACKRAGIVVHMCVNSSFVTAEGPDSSVRLTGDHISTARAIAKSVEIIGPDAPPSAVMTVSHVDPYFVLQIAQTFYRQPSSIDSLTRKSMPFLNCLSSSPVALRKPKCE